MRHIHDVRGTGSTGRAAADWLLTASEDPGRVRLKWASGDGLADLPVGEAFDLIRMAEHLGTAVLEDLWRRDAPTGPVMLAATSRVLSYLVPPGTAEEWREWLTDAPYGRRCSVTAAGPGRVLRCPRPGSVRRGHRWLVLPGGPLTDSRALRAALEESARPEGRLSSALFSV